MVEFVVQNWSWIFLGVALIAAAIGLFAIARSASKEMLLDSMREWLLYATTLAEKELGSGTGALKLRYVYDMFLTKFPWLAKFVSFDYFSELVDVVLDDMKTLLSTNTAVNDYVNKE